MLLKELFEKDNVECPLWLSDYYITDDGWVYSFEDGIHKWRFTDEARDMEIRFDGESYTLGAYFDNDFNVLQRINESEVIHV